MTGKNVRQMSSIASWVILILFLIIIWIVLSLPRVNYYNPKYHHFDNVSRVCQNISDFTALKVRLCKELKVSIWDLIRKVEFSYVIDDRKIITIWVFANETLVYMNITYNKGDMLKL